MNMRLYSSVISLYLAEQVLGNPPRLANFALRLVPDYIGAIALMACPSWKVNTYF